MKTITEYIENYLCVCKPILESNGLYNGCQEMAEYIVNQCLQFNYVKEKNDTLKISTKTCDFPNVFFSKCFVAFIDDCDYEAAYLPAMTKTAHISKLVSNLIKKYPKLNNFIDKEYNFSEIKMTVSTEIFNKDADKRNYISTFAHELIHAYNDYCSQLNGVNMFSQEQMRKDGLDQQKYSKTKSADDDIISHIIYLFNKSEINAFIACAVSSFLQYKDEIKTKEDLNKFLSKDTTTQHYRKLFGSLYAMTLIKDKKRQENIVNAYNDHFNTNKTFENICKDLMRTYNKIAHKLNKIFGKLYLDCLNKNIVDAKPVLYELKKSDLTGKNFETLFKEIQSGNFKL